MKESSPENPIKVFVFGSSSIQRINRDVLKLLDELVELHQPEFLIGDSNGAEELVQMHLDAIGYQNVRVFCSGQSPRHAHFSNVVSMWYQTQGKTGVNFQQVKDDAMVQECDFAIALWDGVSPGTKANIARCKAKGKPYKVIKM